MNDPNDKVELDGWDEFALFNGERGSAIITRRLLWDF
jgi:hypothetical protein